ncbi:MAG: metallopeptidase TldD-related protein, partial [bacterium]
NLPAATYEDERFGSMFPEPAFGNKLNRRVLPDFFDVYDDPTISEFEGLKLIGHYEVDDAGVKPQRLHLVEKGKLRTVPLATAPTKKITEPNGHARGAVSKAVTGKPSNLIFESSDQVSKEKLRQTLIELCQDVDLEYGLVIRKIRDLNAPNPNGGMRFYGMPQQDGDGLTSPLEVYKLYPDGREVPVRGLEFANVTVRTLRDILQTDNSRHLYNYLIADDYEMPASLVSPAILIEEMELGHSEGKTQRPPVLSSPLAEN